MFLMIKYISISTENTLSRHGRTQSVKFRIRSPAFLSKRFQKIKLKRWINERTNSFEFMNDLYVSNLVTNYLDMDDIDIDH